MVISSVGGAFSMNETCPECHGRQLVYDESCPTCHGSGRGRSSRTLQVRIPAGVKGGQRISLKAKGSAGENGGPPGDLFVTVHVRKHPLFGRKGDNLTLRCRWASTRPRSAPRSRCPRWPGARSRCGSRPAHPTAGSSGCAAADPSRKDGSKGDLLVTVDVQVPADLDDAARAAVTAYREATADKDPRAALFERCAMPR